MLSQYSGGTVVLNITVDYSKNFAEFSVESVSTKLQELVNSGICAKWSKEILDYATFEENMAKAHFYVMTVS